MACDPNGRSGSKSDTELRSWGTIVAGARWPFESPTMRLIPFALLVASLLGPGAAHGAQRTAADLAATLQQQREVCASLAKEANQSFERAQFQARLDGDTARLKAEMDARVYGVGHGRQQTAEFYVSRLQRVSEEQSEKSKASSEAFKAAELEVDQCVADAKIAGKASYTAFKKAQVSPSVRKEAESLMSAWLTNISEITASKPNGEDESFNAWKAAKAHAEVSSL